MVTPKPPTAWLPLPQLQLLLQALCSSPVGLLALPGALRHGPSWGFCRVVPSAGNILPPDNPMANPHLLQTFAQHHLSLEACSNYLHKIASCFQPLPNSGSLISPTLPAFLRHSLPLTHYTMPIVDHVSPPCYTEALQAQGFVLFCPGPRAVAGKWNTYEMEKFLTLLSPSLPIF